MCSSTFGRTPERNPLIRRSKPKGKENTTRVLIEKSLARPTSRCVLFDDEIISFDASLVIHIKSTNIPPIMLINRIYENQNLLSLYLVFFLSG